jgi:hypothetical protein
MSQQQGDYPVYQEIVQNEEGDAPAVVETSQHEELVHTPENQAVIDNSTKWVCCLLIVQMVCTFPLRNNIASKLINLNAAYFDSELGTWPLRRHLPVLQPLHGHCRLGWRAPRVLLLDRRCTFPRPIFCWQLSHWPHLLQHFLYSMLCLFGLVMAFSLAVFYTAEVSEQLLIVLVGSCGIILTLSFLLRKQRLLIQALCAKKGTTSPFVLSINQDLILIIYLSYAWLCGSPCRC